MHRDPVVVVRELWAAYSRGGIAATLELADEGVEWIPHTAGGRVLHGHEELRRWAAANEVEGLTLEAHIYALDRHGDAVLVAGHLSVRRDGEEVSRGPLHWRYTFRDGRLVRAESFPSREAALDAPGG